MTFETVAGEPDALTALVEVVFLPALCAPFAVFHKRTQSEHDMGMWVAIAFVMDGEIHAHSR